MAFIVEKDPGLIPQVLAKILDSCVNGVTLADPDLDDMPVVYVNKAFEEITGYDQGEIVGKNCRFLQGNDRDQDARTQIREALANAQPVEVTLRNYRKNGELFYNHLALTPLFDRDGKVIYYLGIQYDVTNQVRAEEEIKRLSENLENVSRLTK
ncbi:MULTISPECIES: PAS domain-containing protein [Methylocaldum]|jgi:PAS domain S-box-containing protein|uniref:PAS domain-containing protein n=1 Tax=unclassified Methylocaldum TaxID=2622260 RepID=UPI00098B8B5C|nr:MULTISPECIES: PAS domain-containing protein [unclassified Methylocaldum]MBP1150924.1 PAS domain S-box-containing protein [Methylocaldum sp. RMAD-M]MDV3241942.1 PAS domain-containing protein [Methylocaldum sp.]MVF21072.1 PAS domain-containing protein [Methylocaldum sp. BRCS4]